MPDTNINFKRVDVRSASEQEYGCLGEFKNLLHREYYPDDPPIPLEEQIQGWKNIPGFVENRVYVGWNPSMTEILASCEVAVEHLEDNKHLAYFEIEVVPELRCRGLGRQMLSMLVPFAKEHNRTLFMVRTSDRIPAGANFVERIGARRGQEARTNQLAIADLDRSLVDRWLDQSRGLEQAFEMGLWDGAVPEEHVVELAALLQQLINDQPRDALEMEDMKYTPEILREVEKYFFGKGDKRWVLYVVDRANGKFVGLTEVRWSPNRPNILDQGFTAVYPTYRNRGLGRWLKAVMMKRILQERPEVEFIRTGNANSNAPMLKINIEMGFKPYFAMTFWQVPVAQVESYLGLS
jgi:GNAT superfamily N-acetyltransferase